MVDPLYNIWVYSKTCLKRPLKNWLNKDLNDKWLNLSYTLQAWNWIIAFNPLYSSLMKVESIGAFCNTFDLQ